MANKEVEIKVLGIERNALEKAVLGAGGEEIPAGFIVCRHFDYSDGRLHKEGKLIRVRNVGDKVEFAFKGPKEDSGRCKIRPEFQTLVDSADVVIKILKEIGLEQTLYCEKKRWSYRLDGARIDIDEYPGGIVYAEIEAPTEELVYAIVDKLGLSEYEISCETAFSLFKRKWPEVNICNLAYSGRLQTDCS